MTIGHGYTSEDLRTRLSMSDYMEKYLDFGRIRTFCHECRRYGNCWACPPYDSDEREYLNRFRTIEIIATVITPEEGRLLTRTNAEETIAQERKRLDKVLLEEEARIDSTNGYARAFFAGTCLLCPLEQCTRRENRPCRHPGMLRPSLEAMGFDVSRTVTGLFGIELSWSSDGQPPEYLTLVSALAIQ